LLPMFRSLCACVFVGYNHELCAKTAEPIEMTTPVHGTNDPCIKWGPGPP